MAEQGEAVLAGGAPTQLDGTVTDDTLLAPDTLEDGAGDISTQDTVVPSGSVAAVARQSSGHKITVLPRLVQTGEAPQIVQEEQDRYSLTRPLGEGAAGEVHLVIDNDIQRQVAVKRLKAGPSETAPLLRFVDEIRMVGSLEHPNIVPIHDVGLDEQGCYYFVMKYVEGDTLEQIIDRLAVGDRETHEKYTFDYRARVFREILKAVEFAHSRGVIHRDLKPANIMVGPYGEVMVMDWGIAKRIGDGPPVMPVDDAASSRDTLQSRPTAERMYRTEFQSIIGTPAYMSPEQAMGQVDDLDERSDIFSLFAVFYELMTLRSRLPPCQSIKELIASVVSAEVTAPLSWKHEHQPRVPSEYSYFIMRGLEKDPADRFPSVAEVRQSLQRIEEGFIPVQCPVTATKRGLHGYLRFIDHHPVASLLTSVGIVGGALGLGATLVFLMS